MVNLYFLIFLLPLLAFPLEYIIGRYRIKYSGVFSSLMILGSLVLVILAYLHLLNHNFIYSHYTWFYNIDLGIYIDHLTVIMAAAVILLTLMELRNIKDMGGLFRKMPATAILMLIGALTLAAIPPTAGYFSKGQIISGAYEYFVNSGNIIPWLLLVLGEILTATYTFRMYFLVFLGKPRSELAEKAHDPKLIYLSPLIVLAFLSLTLGIIQKPFYRFIDSSVYIYSPPFAIGALPVAFSLLGILIAYGIYRYNIKGHMNIVKNPLYKIIKNKFYFDRLYTEIISERIILPIAYLIGAGERKYNDRINSMGKDISDIGTDFRKIETGNIPFYVAFLIVGMIVIFAIIEIMGVI